MLLPCIMTDVNVMFKADVIAFVVLWQILCHVFLADVIAIMWKTLNYMF